ncbi:integral membrane protein [Dothidotthia symphoricarpi CBS 119687]|uniref:Integral membrane protein n=1 Tax=Dothidotthia symphoricarpi CBS 119687 TaxID=1392245 RepID=A0A6A6AS06_9PLEO|nr:uncharacterized protein P153DRAFT_278559 [Dothidotthia symphoricarpi CBS 119687]KAF2134719.1 integral membrane protein [Dothidotthia symphoricarpi CBS 119687]
MSGGIHPPPEVVASWPNPNFVSPATHSYATVVLLAVFGPLTLLAVFARIWARAVIQRKSGLDDWVMLASLVPTTALLIAVGIGNQRLFNRHIWDYHSSEFIEQRKLTMANEAAYVLSSGMIKASILLFYRRMVFKAVRKAYKIIVIVSLASIVLYTFGFLLAMCFACRPLNAFWNQLDRSKVKAGFTYKCYNESAHLLATSIIVTLQDFVTTTLPAVLCWKLHITVRQRFALYACFGIGYVVTIISALRCYAIYYVFSNTYDVPWHTWYVWILTGLELSVGTICASVPALKVFFKHFRDASSQSRDTDDTELGINKIKFLHKMGRSNSVGSDPEEIRSQPLSNVQTLESSHSAIRLNDSYASKE